MAVEAVVDLPVTALLDAVHAIRTTPAPAGQEPARLAALAHASAELRGVFLCELGTIDPAAHGARNPADLLVTAAGIPTWQARRDAALARRLAAVPGLADTVAGGGLELDAALLLVRAWTALPTRLHDQQLAAALITLGQLIDLRDLRAKVDELLAALAPDVTDSDLADAREAAELTLTDVGSTTRWTGTTDALTGELARDVLHAKAATLRSSNDPRTGPQLLMAALVALLTDHTSDDPDGSSGSSTSSPAGATIVVVTSIDDLAACADTHADGVQPDQALDTLFHGTPLARPHAEPDADDDGPTGDQASDNGGPSCDGRATGHGSETAAAGPRRPSWSTRSRGGLPLGPRTLSALACNSVLTRLVLSPLGHPLDSNPTSRRASRRERRALEHRADYRCQRHGCGRPASTCIPHHVVPWALGGLTTMDNQVLLCLSCHHLLHDRRQPLLLTDGRRIGPRGWLRGNPDPGPPP